VSEQFKQENFIWIIFKYSVCTAHFGYDNQLVICVSSESHTKHTDTLCNRPAHLSRSFGSHETYFSGTTVWWAWSRSTINTNFFFFELIIGRICCDFIFSPWTLIWYNFLLHTINVARITLLRSVFTVHNLCEIIKLYSTFLFLQLSVCPTSHMTVSLSANHPSLCYPHWPYVSLTRCNWPSSFTNICIPTFQKVILNLRTYLFTYLLHGAESFLRS